MRGVKVPNVIYINPYVYAGVAPSPPNPPQNVTITSAAQNTGVGSTGTAGTANAVTAVAFYIDGGGNPATNVQTVSNGGTINFTNLIADLGGPAEEWLWIGFFADVTTSGGGTPAQYSWQLSVSAPQNSNVVQLLFDGGAGPGIYAGAQGGKADYSKTYDGPQNPELQFLWGQNGIGPQELILDGLGETPMMGETVQLTFTCVATTSGGDAGNATPVVVNMTL